VVTVAAVAEMRRNRGLWFGCESPQKLASTRDWDKNEDVAVNDGGGGLQRRPARWPRRWRGVERVEEEKGKKMTPSPGG
jgi:hypothetical protein